MTRADRAKQFLPFDALKGLHEELEAREEKMSRVPKHSMTEELVTGMIQSAIDQGLSLAVPPAGVIKELTDALVTTLQFAIVIKDVSSMAGNSNDFLIIVYPAKPVY